MTIWSFRLLAVFWAGVGSLMAMCGLALQLMGPLPPAPSRLVTHETRPENRPAAAYLPPSAPHPAPALAMTGASIPDPDPALLEPATTLPDRMLPRRQGRRMPATLYAAAFDAAERHPRIALILDGAGLDEAVTRQSMANLPPAIDLAFSAYTPPVRAAALAGAARRQGRECLVSIPMEPSGYPTAAEGGRALLTGAAPAQNRQNLEWALSAVAGCVGATGASDGLAGERYVQSPLSFADLLAELDQRGLIYLDPRPGAPAPGDAGASGRRPRYQVDVVVDRPPAPGEAADASLIDRQLAELTDAALHHGEAIGLAGPPSPVLLDRVAVWAHGLAARGIVLAPLTALPPPAAPSPSQGGAR